MLLYLVMDQVLTFPKPVPGFENSSSTTSIDLVKNKEKMKK